jgi:uncharacterized protein (DUF1697 family)
MATFIALLRSVNVGGTGKLPMADLKALCVKAGFTNVRTYIASGNVVLDAKVPAARVKAALEAALHKRVGKPIQVLIRTADELEAVVAANPYPEAAPNQLIVLFLDHEPRESSIADWPIPGRERMTLKGRELFLHFPDGQGTSKLRVPFADVGTGRNLNTVRAVLALARDAR